MYIKLFGYFLAAGILLTSFAMAILGGRWQRLEASAYAEKQRPWWFWTGSLLIIALYIAALVHFANTDRNLAGWFLIVIIPLGWAVKGGLVIFNHQGRQAVTSLKGDQSWRKVALARLPAALLLAVLAYFS